MRRPSSRTNDAKEKAVMTDVRARALGSDHLADHRGRCPRGSQWPVEPQVLRPFHRSEALSIAEAAEIAGRSPRCIREWCLLHDIGRRIGGQWAVSRVAFAMFLDGDKLALQAYLAGDRSSPTVTAYFERRGVPLPRQQIHGLAGVRERQLSELNGTSEP